MIGVIRLPFCRDVLLLNKAMELFECLRIACPVSGEVEGHRLISIFNKRAAWWYSVPKLEPMITGILCKNLIHVHNSPGLTGIVL